MPFGLLDRELSMTAKLALAFVLFGLAWVGFQSGVLTALFALGVSSPTVVGLVILALFAYWAFDELEDEDGTRDVISKTADRAESATGGFLDSTAALLLGGVAILATVGMQALDGAAALLEVAVSVPLVAANLGTIGALLGGMLGLLTFETILVIAVVLLGLGLVARRRKRMGA